ncbi:F-box/LRR-repeat protein 2 isoform X5 [Talpa occidentalis]|uniref:F-box/LRR-repeat protein 2 isoform X5 n=1 Tax=Talpa occidentalis TaxID=50954 RepID=UPI0023F76F84|nr:F-box/LRR-repeat protein 2 isoform X5 [Talpa occidentalis]
MSLFNWQNNCQVFSNNDEGLINKKLPKELLLRMLFSLLLNFTWSNPECTKYVHSIGLDSFCNVAWNILALDGSNWQRIDLFNFQTDVEGRVVENISKRCGGFLRKLSLRGCIGVGDSSLKTFAQNCRNIEHLNLNGCTKITDSTCYSLSRFCSKLKHLDLTSCVSITNSSLKGISEGCRNLEYLNLSWCDQITKDGIEALVRGCRGLKALLLRGCTQLEDEALKHIQNYCHELVSLNLQSCSSEAREGERIHQSQSGEQSSQKDRSTVLRGAAGGRRGLHAMWDPPPVAQEQPGIDRHCKGCGQLRNPALNHCTTGKALFLLFLMQLKKYKYTCIFTCIT